jgi:DUF4097 and DUF4098 domain-containing protein YvlB
MVGWVLLSQMVLAEPFLVEEYAFEAGHTLEVELQFGSITVEPWDEAGVRFALEACSLAGKNHEALRQEYTVESSPLPDGLRLASRFPEQGSWWGMSRNRPQLHLKLSVPEATHLTLKTSGGSVSVAQLRGDLRVRTSGGSIRLEQVDGTVDLHTSGGSISLNETSGNALVKTSGGSIRLGRILGEVQARTSGGSITVDEVFGPIQATTSGGSIRVTLSDQPQNHCLLKTSGGSITVRMTQPLGLQINAKTSGGRVHCDFPLDQATLLEKNEIQGLINGGGPLLSLKTSGGGIYIVDESH